MALLLADRVAALTVATHIGVGMQGE